MKMKHTNINHPKPDDPVELSPVFDDAGKQVGYLLLNKPWTEGVIAPKRHKKKVSLYLDQDIIDHFKAQGRFWQTRLNDALRELIK